MEILACSQETMASADHSRFVATGWTDGPSSRLHLCAFYLYTFLEGLNMYIMGISAFYHDSAACLIKDGEIVAAAQEERFTRKKHDSGFPDNAIAYCLKEAEIEGKQIDEVVFYEKPFLKFERLLETYLAFAPRGFRSFAKSMPLWLKDRLFQKSQLSKRLAIALDPDVDWRSRLLFSEHHLSHAASAFFPSPFERAAVLTLDGVGEWTTTSIAVGNNRDLQLRKEIHFPHSLGLLYSAFTYYLGFKVNSGEYKVMGLAPYGVPRFAELIRERLIDVAEDGSFRLDMSYFGFSTQLEMTSQKFHNLFEAPPRVPEAPLTQREMDIAASIQKVTEEVVVALARTVAVETGEKNLCLAGGVALNCVANGILLREKIFDQIWIQPAAGDAGGALGAALAVWHLHHQGERVVTAGRDSMKGAYLGPEYSDEEIEAQLRACSAVYRKLTRTELIDRVVVALADGKAVGWMQGRMEFGPRALGGRSILADPRSPKMQNQLNLKVKFREGFRPFAPSVLSNDVGEWFELDLESPYMLLVANLQKTKRLETSKVDASRVGFDKLNATRSSVPAVTHVDFSARIQTVHADTNSLYFDLISKFKAKTGCPMVVNTSLNVRGEPIVCTPSDAFRCFMGTDLDCLAIGTFLLLKEDQDLTLKQNYENLYELD